MTLGTVWRQEGPLWNPFTVHLGKGETQRSHPEMSGGSKEDRLESNSGVNSGQFGGHFNVGQSEDEPEVSNWELRLVVTVLVPDQDTRGE